MIITITFLFLLLILVIRLSPCAEHLVKTLRSSLRYLVGKVLTPPGLPGPPWPGSCLPLCPPLCPLLPGSGLAATPATCRHEERAPTSGPFQGLFLVPGMPFSACSVVGRFTSLRSWSKRCYLPQSPPSLLYLKQQALSLSIPLTQLYCSVEHLLSDEIL